jgi:Domain of unknown function (DUF4365)
VQLEFARWGWPFAQSHADFGLDAQVMAAEDGFLSGRCVGLVIKSGGSFFSEPVSGGWLYRGPLCRNKDLLYWMGYSLPVVFLFHNPDTGPANDIGACLLQT